MFEVKVKVKGERKLRRFTCERALWAAYVVDRDNLPVPIGTLQAADFQATFAPREWEWFEVRGVNPNV